LKVRGLINGLVKTYAMVMRLSSPLHAHPVSHDRSPKPYTRKPQKGTATVGPQSGPGTSPGSPPWKDVLNSEQVVADRQEQRSTGLRTGTPTRQRCRSVAMFRSLHAKTPVEDRLQLYLRHRAYGHCSKIRSGITAYGSRTH
jgi:hypothetical protein